jgi:GH24 family phage-related lysozyme (muramidase)
MNLEKLREQISIDEGIEYNIYLDHLGYPTFGIGHLIIDSDPEKGQEVGTSVSEERVNQAFDDDVQTVVADCKICFESWDGYPEEAQQVFANMMFNMGRTRLSKFKMMIAAAEAGAWKQAATEGRDSRWHKQVTNRAERLMSRLENI